MNQNNTGGKGRLIVQVRTADGSIPVEGATVRVKEYGQDDTRLLAVMTTDNSGATEVLEIDTPSPAMSTSPGQGIGYTSLIIQADKDGFYPQEFIGATVFPGVTTIQPVNLLPYSEDTSQTPDTTYFEGEGYDL